MGMKSQFCVGGAAPGWKGGSLTWWIPDYIDSGRRGSSSIGKWFQFQPDPLLVGVDSFCGLHTEFSVQNCFRAGYRNFADARFGVWPTRPHFRQL